MHVKHKRLLASGLAVAFIVGLGGIQAAMAINPDDTGLGATAATALGKANAGKSLTVMIGQLINAVLRLVGVILVSLIIYAGFLWMTAQGEPDKVKKAKAIITNAVVGMIIVFSAYSIADYAFKNVFKATMEGGTSSGTETPAGGAAGTSDNTAFDNCLKNCQGAACETCGTLIRQ